MDTRYCSGRLFVGLTRPINRLQAPLGYAAFLSLGIELCSTLFCALSSALPFSCHFVALSFCCVIFASSTLLSLSALFFLLVALSLSRADFFCHLFFSCFSFPFPLFQVLISLGLSLLSHSQRSFRLQSVPQTTASL